MMKSSRAEKDKKTRQHKRCNKKNIYIYDTTIKGIRNLFRLNKNEAIKNKVIRLEILGTFSACRRRQLINLLN